MRMKIAFMLFAFAAILYVGCGSQTDVVESGSYSGTIKKVETDKREIYVTTEDDKTLELYFTDETTLTRQGSPVEFSVLQAGQKVQVTVERVGKRLDPVSVNIME